ncbi:MAG: AAA family ATPase, partial [Tannerella sp.]|nr:AAA family ATPase [Tannerella sp.]
MNGNKTVKILPYGNSNFKDIILNNYAYVDKTRYIEMLERESNRNQLFIRPRKFGKSLFLTTLMSYYDINEEENFDKLFGNLYIGKHPTPKRNAYAVIKFDFSGLNTKSEEGFTKSFSSRVQDTVRKFLERYRPVFSEAGLYIRQIDEEQPGINALSKMVAVATEEIRIFIVIDEYDQFANDLIAKGTSQGKDMYKIMVTANGLVRDFYERIKTAAIDAVVYRTFITGISPVMLDDMTSGYNIASNFTLDPWYNEMLGFTRSEVEWLMNETGVEPSLINIDMEAYYNGYMFNPDCENRDYNPTMVLYIFQQILKRKKITEIIDGNIKTDYSRLSNLIQDENNRQTLIEIIDKGGITVSEIMEQFSV